MDGYNNMNKNLNHKTDRIINNEMNDNNVNEMNDDNNVNEINNHSTDNNCCMGSPFLQTQYFEGILQLRNPVPEVEEYILSKVARDNKGKISKIKPVEGGLDYYFTSQKYLVALGKHLQEKFGGELIVSRRLFSRNRQTSKEVFRVTVLLRIPKFKVGDIVKIRRDVVKVTGIGKKIRGVSVETGRKVCISFKQLQ